MTLIRSHIKFLVSPGFHQALTRPESESTAKPTRTEPANCPESPEVKLWTVYRENQPDLQFEGVKLGDVSKPIMTARRGWRFVVFKTKSEKIVAVKLGLTAVHGESETVETKVLENINSVIEFFGYTDLAKDLYNKLGLNVTEVIA